MVAASAIAGLVPHLRARSVDARAALLVGGAGAPASLLAAAAARHLDDAAQSLLFAGVAAVAGALLVRRGPSPPPDEGAPRPAGGTGRALLAGVGAGALTGLVGVGGGFVVVPALVLVVGLAPRRAVGTSLVIVATNAIAGLVGGGRLDLTTQPLPWFLAGAVLAGVLGAALAARAPQARLRRVLGVALIVTAVFVLSAAVRSLSSRHSAGSSSRRRDTGEVRSSVAGFAQRAAGPVRMSAASSAT